MSDKNYGATDVRIAASGVTLAGWYYCPQGPGPFPYYSDVAGVRLRERAMVDLLPRRSPRRASRCSFTITGISGRAVACCAARFRPGSRWRTWSAVTWLCSRPDTDPGCIGLWGSSYSGGHVIVLGATDRRLRCVVAQVPTISGYQTFLRRVAPPLVEGVLKTMAEDRARCYAGGKPARRCVIPDGDTPGIYNGADAVSSRGPPL